MEVAKPPQNLLEVVSATSIWSHGVTVPPNPANWGWLDHPQFYFGFLCFVYFFFILYLTFFKFFVLYFIFLTPGAFWGLHPLKKLDFCISYEKAVLLMDGQTCQRLKLWRIHLPVFKHLRQD